MAADPGDQPVKGSNVKIKSFVDAGEDAVWIEEDIEQEPGAAEAEQDAFGVCPFGGWSCRLGNGLG